MMGKNATKKIFLGLLMIFGFILNVGAQQAADANVKRFCDGETVSYNDAAATIPAGYAPKLYYSANKITAPADPADPTTGATSATLSGTTISNPKTGYYYLKGVPTDASLCVVW